MMIMKLFCFPWSYKLKPLETDSVFRAKLIEKDITDGIDAKIDTLEKKMDVKNKAIVELIEAKF